MKIIVVGAMWCTNCATMRPIWQEIVKEWQEKYHHQLDFTYYEFDTEAGQEVRTKYQVGNDLPVFIFLNKKNQEISRKIGITNKDELFKILQNCKNK